MNMIPQEKIQRLLCENKIDRKEAFELFKLNIIDITNQKITNIAYLGSLLAAFSGAFAGSVLTASILYPGKLLAITLMGAVVAVLVFLLIQWRINSLNNKENDKINDELTLIDTLNRTKQARKQK